MTVVVPLQTWQPPFVRQLLCPSPTDGTVEWLYSKTTCKYTGKISKYQLSGLAGALEHIPNDHWVLSPLFKSREIFDAQFGCVTGKCKLEETDKEAVVREVAEELGIFIHDPEQAKLVVCGDCTYFTVRVTTTTAYNSGTNYEFSTRDDDKTRRVGVIIHGTEKEVLDCVNRLETVHGRHLPKADKVFGVVGMPTAMALCCAQHLPTRQIGTINQSDVVRWAQMR